MKVKVCGMNDEKNLRSLLKIPIEFVGFIFYENSKRNCQIQPEQLAKTFAEATAYTPKKIGVFVNEQEDVLIEKVKEFDLDFVQLHGSESLFYCEKLKEQGISIIKAFLIDDDFCFSNTDAYKYYADYFLFDTKGKKAGGTGKKFNWNKLKEYKAETPFFLSGGISIDDIEAIRNLNHPMLFAVDINSRFESKPGSKKLKEVEEFNYKIKKHRPQNEYINVKINE